jgi:hypothetical protein
MQLLLLSHVLSMQFFKKKCGFKHVVDTGNHILLMI